MTVLGYNACPRSARGRARSVQVATLDLQRFAEMPEPEVVLAFDVGNSRTKVGLFADRRLSLRTPSDAAALPVCRKSWQAPHPTALPWEELLRALENVLRTPSETQGLSSVRSVLSGSNPAEIRRIRESWPTERGLPAPTLIDSWRQLPLLVDVERPEKVGLDRLLGTVAARVLCRNGQAALVVDSGTATTVNVLAAGDVFAGGAILPGLQLSSRALHEYTALLPLIEMDGLADGPPPVVGRDTVGALRSGIFWGQVGAIREVVERISLDLGGPAPLVLLTGGGGRLLADVLRLGDWHEHLVLQGLATAAEHVWSGGDAG